MISISYSSCLHHTNSRKYFSPQHVFYSEELTGFEATSSKGPSISPLTLALLEDSSWYTANYKVSAETSFGRGAGCQFARSGCLFDEASSEINSDASTFHCTEIGEMGCDASHSYKARCDFLDSVVSRKHDIVSPIDLVDIIIFNLVFLHSLLTGTLSGEFVLSNACS